MAQKITQTNRLCPNCKAKNLTQVGFKDNHGEFEIMEIHCSLQSGGCGYAEDAEGVIRNPGTKFIKEEQGQSDKDNEGAFNLGTEDNNLWWT